MRIGGFEPRFVPSTAARRFVLIEEEETEVPSDPRPAPDRGPRRFSQVAPILMLVLAGIAIGSLCALVYAYRPGIG